jgi:hypothetical protein
MAYSLIDDPAQPAPSAEVRNYIKLVADKFRYFVPSGVKDRYNDLARRLVLRPQRKVIRALVNAERETLRDYLNT